MDRAGLHQRPDSPVPGGRGTIRGLSSRVPSATRRPDGLRGSRRRVFKPGRPPPAPASAGERTASIPSFLLAAPLLFCRPGRSVRCTWTLKPFSFAKIYLSQQARLPVHPPLRLIHPGSPPGARDSAKPRPSVLARQVGPVSTPCRPSPVQPELPDRPGCRMCCPSHSRTKGGDARSGRVPRIRSTNCGGQVETRPASFKTSGSESSSLSTLGMRKFRFNLLIRQGFFC